MHIKFGTVSFSETQHGLDVFQKETGLFNEFVDIHIFRRSLFICLSRRLLSPKDKILFSFGTA